MSRHRWLVMVPVAALFFASSAEAQAPGKAAAKKDVVKPSAAERESIRKLLQTASREITEVESRADLSDDLKSDTLVFLRAARMMDEFDEFGHAEDVRMITGLIAAAELRADSLRKGETTWTRQTGPVPVVRGYRSKVDGSIQPYAVEIPASLDQSKPCRLDVILHGRNDGMNEARFIQSHLKTKVPADRGYLTLHVFGRGNNAYRWAGEADVFEAIDAVRRNYKVDDDRILLRGFSMGGAGAWHIGLHFPSSWCSVEAGAGFTETLRYARLEGKPLPDYRRKALTIYDATDYARNAFDVPIIGYGGEDDPQLQASTNIVDALKADGVAFKVDDLVTTADGLDFRRVIGKGMGHRVDPASQALLMTFHDDHAKAGINHTPRQIRFVTHTLAYNTAHWISVERMTEHYKRASVDADLDGEVARIRTSNVTVLGVDRQVAEKLVLDGTELPLRLEAKGLLPRVYYRKGSEGWGALDHEASIALIENADRQKAPGVQGPIDDAFRGSFLVITPTGTPWHAETAAWSRARLDRFVRDWRRHFRGEVRIKADTALTDADIDGHHLILFGDPGSNAVLGRLLKGLPIEWSKERIVLGGSYEAATRAPAFVAVNPINPRRYVVVNSGMTFEPSDFAGTNALLFPRLGDFAVFRLDGGAGELLTSGYFDERWRQPK